MNRTQYHAALRKGTTGLYLSGLSVGKNMFDADEISKLTIRLIGR